MRRFTILCWVLLLSGFTALQAQSISGKITDDSGEGLIGASILVAGTNSGTVTDLDGNFELNVPANAERLVITYTGYTTLEVPLVAGQTTYNLTLIESATALGEVVVTAVGVERSKRELGYAVSTIGGDEVGTVRETNVINSLQGKVSGVQISQQSGNLGGSTKILIRGINSLSGGNNPLWVVDGVPIFDSNITTGDQITGGFDTGNRAQDINPDDIESISVLKGANAAALYGSRAANGAIIVTTKKGGKDGNRANITFNSTVRADQVLRLPDFQNEYAQGNLGRYSLDNLNGWGPRIEGQMVENINGEMVPLQAFEDNVRDFYETGSTLINNLAIGGGSENGNYRFSMTSLNQQGIFPGSELDRFTLGFNAGQKFDQKVSSSFGINLVRSTSAGRVAQGGNDPNVLVPIINNFPRNLDLNTITDYIDESSGVGEQLNNLGPNTNNPYWIANENRFDTETDRVYGNFALTYEPVFWLDFTSRVGLDFISDNRFRSNRKGTLGRLQGDFTDDRIEQRQLDYNFLATAANEIGGKFFIKAIAGFNYNQRVFERLQNFAQNLTVDELFSTGNAEVNNVSNDFSERRLFGVYGDVTLTYNDYLSLNVTGRNDWSSTLPLNNNSYFYPSVGLSFVFTDAFEIDNSILTYGKIRSSFAEVGGDTGPYQLAFNYNDQTEAFGQFGTSTNFPFNGRLAFSGPNTIPPENLRPESVNSFEIGTELQFFEGRFGIDATYYNVVTTDQILAVPIPQSTGFGFQLLNVGQTSNEGFEVEMNITPVQTSDFQWNSLFTLTKNRFVVDELSPGTDRLVINSGFNSLQIVAEPGKSFGLYANTFARVAADSSLALADQRVLVDPNTGLRQAGENQRIGDVFPEWIMGWTNNLNYKGLNLRFTFDYRIGGLLYSNTVADLRASGLAAETAVNREGAVVDTDAWIQEEDGTVRPNDIPVTAQAFWGNYSDGSITENSIFDASFIKLREVALNYSLPTSILEKVPFRSVTIGVEARNLAIIASEIPHIDPETNLFGSANDGAGIEFNSPPTTRTFGVNLRLGF